jgi:hypothetical protein
MVLKALKYIRKAVVAETVSNARRALPPERRPQRTFAAMTMDTTKYARSRW